MNSCTLATVNKHASLPQCLVEHKTSLFTEPPPTPKKIKEYYLKCSSIYFFNLQQTEVPQLHQMA